MKLPLMPPSTNRLLRMATLALDNSGNLKGSVQEIRRGQVATALRQSLLNLPNMQRQKVFQDLLTNLLVADGAVLTSAGVSNLKEAGAPLSITYEFTARAYAEHAGESSCFVPVCWVARAVTCWRVSLASRR